MITLQMLLKAASDGAELNFKRDGFVRPMWLAIDKNDGFVPIPPPVDFRDEAHKQVCAVLVRALLTLIGAKRVVFVAESWMAEGPDEDRTTPVADRPGRFEVVHFEAEDQAGEYVTARRRILREGARARLGELELMPTAISEGLMVGWLPKPPGRPN